MSTVTRTFQLRTDQHADTLERMGANYGVIKRSLYARARKAGKTFSAFKTEICHEWGITARQFNAIDADLRGCVEAVQEKAKVDLADVEDKLQRATARRDTLRRKKTRKPLSKKQAGELVRRTRTVQRLEARAARLRATLAEDYPKICFGSRTLFNSQHHPDKNGAYAPKTWHRHWRRRWRAARSDEIHVIGSADEPAGNKTCRARIRDDGTVDLSLATFDGEPITFQGLQLPHGHDEWLAAIRGADAESQTSQAFQNETKRRVAAHTAADDWPVDVIREAKDQDISTEKAFRRQRRRERRKQAKQGHAVSYRFKRDRYGWRILVTVHQPVAEVVPDYANGAIGVDVNADHLAVASVRADGALAGTLRLDTPVAHKRTGQRRDIYRNAARLIVERARAEGRPIVAEDLDFAKKRARLRELGNAHEARMLSGFAVTMFRQALVSAAKRAGVALRFVNPAYTSVIGATRAVRNGISTHLAAALVVARRAMGCPETLPEKVRLPAGHHRPVVLAVPRDLQGKAVDAKGTSARLARTVKAALAARPQPPTGKERRRQRRIDKDDADDDAFLKSLAVPCGTG